MYEACPFGERRADIRNAITAINTIISTSPAKTEAADANRMFEKIRDYLKCYAEVTDEYEEIDHAALRKVKGTT